MHLCGEAAFLQTVTYPLWGTQPNEATPGFLHVQTGDRLSEHPLRTGDAELMLLTLEGLNELEPCRPHWPVRDTRWPRSGQQFSWD